MKKLLFKIQKKGELNTAYSDFAAKQIRTIFPQAQRPQVFFTRQRPCLDAVKAKRKIFINHLYDVLNIVEK